MNYFESLKSLITKSSSQKDQSIPEGYCPNCWGHQEYGGKFFEAVKVERIDASNVDSKKGWIQAYAEKHLNGIQVKEKDGELICNSCSVAYKPK